MFYVSGGNMFLHEYDHQYEGTCSYINMIINMISGRLHDNHIYVRK